MTQPSAVPGPHPGPPPSGAEHTPSAVTEALARLDDLDTLPVSGHVAVFDEVHRLLQNALATLDEV